VNEVVSYPVIYIPSFVPWYETTFETFFSGKYIGEKLKNPRFFATDDEVKMSDLRLTNRCVNN
jgi:hypothetical protein